MTKEQFLSTIGDIDDKFIKEITDIPEKPEEVVLLNEEPQVVYLTGERISFRKIAVSVAAVICVLTAGIFAAVKLHGVQPYGPNESGISESSYSEASQSSQASGQSGQDESSSTVSSSDTSSVPDGMLEEKFFTPINDIRRITRGNSFEESASFGHFCAVKNGYYYVDLNDGFLYFMDNGGNTKKVLEDYVRALNYYDGFLYYIKGTKRDFLAMEYFYAGSVWRLDPVSGEETCLIDVSDNMSLNVNEYGIFCNPNGGGLALYGFDGKEIERISNENQGVYFIGNKLLLINEGKTVLRDFDTGEESDFPSDMFLFACVGDKVVCAYTSDPWTKIVLDMSKGEAAVLPSNMVSEFAVLNGELYTVDGDNLYRVDFEKMTYESVISYTFGGPVYFLTLHSDGERLYAVMGNQSDTYRYAEVDLENGELKYLEEQ